MLAQLRSGMDAWRKHAVSVLALPSSVVRYVVPISVFAIVLTLLIVLYLWRDNARYKPVFGTQENVVVADMMAVLDAESIPYRIHPQTGQVLVPENELGRVRIQLAAKGVIAALPAGLELLDKNEPLGVSQFVQDIRFRRGLEGELVQSIRALEPVATARVHLSLPRVTSFVMSSEDKGSASVVVTLKPSRQLSHEQIAAIVNLVAGSVSTLSPSRITVVDQAGNLLSSRIDRMEGLSSNNNNDIARQYREEAIENVHTVLTTLVGHDNFKVSVSADVDNDRIEETHEQYGDVPKITHEASRDEASNDRLALGIPGSLSHRPVSAGTSSPVSERAATSKNAVTRQYVYDHNIKQVKRARGSLRRLSVAVVLNQAAAPTRGGWKPEQLARIESVLRNGLGIRPGRGDALVVTALLFPPPKETAWWMEPETWVATAPSLGYGIALFLVYWLVVRPLLALLRQWMSYRGKATSLMRDDRVQRTPLLPSNESGAVPAIPVTTQAREPRAPVTALGVEPLLEEYGLPPVGSSVDVLVNHLKKLAAQEPERVAEIVKQWIQKYGRKS